ncbi:hypothetical protein HDU67_002359 [Dinochytrium kinnereticum]|nr:hypothetical protein HDU67_002359 [Dinochytrium kinnereticum]
MGSDSTATDKAPASAQHESGEEISEEAAEWQAVFDETSQAWYWWNTVNGETTWDDPNGTEGAEEAGAPAEGQPAENDAENGGAEEEGEVTEDAAGNETSAAVPADYYNSQEYYNWYYSQVAAASAAGDSTSVEADSAAPQATTTTGTEYSSYAGYAAAAYATQHFHATSAAETFQPGDITLSATFNQKTGRFQPDRAGGDSYFNPNAKAERQMAHFFDIDQYQDERNRMRMQEAMMPQAKKKLTKKDIDRFKKKNKEKKLRSLLKRFGPDD